MFDAGSAVFTLTGRVVRTPFEDYGKLIDQARLNKEHSIVLGAKTEDTGFKTFRGNLDSVQKKLDEFRVAAGNQFASVSGYITKMADDSARGLGIVRKELTGTADSFGRVDEAAKGTANVVRDESKRMSDSYSSTARAAKLSADEQVRANERIAESERAAAGGGGGRGYINPVGGGGGGGGDPKEKIAQSNKAMKEGFNTLSNLGKWTSLSLGVVGVVTVKWAADFQRQMELVRTQAGYTQKDVNSLSKSVLDLAPTVGVGPVELSKALYHIASAGIPAAKAMHILKIAAEGAKIGNADVETTTNALVAVMRTAPKDIHGAAEAMGVMTDIVGHGNLRMEDLNKALTTGVLPAARGVGLGLRDLGAALDVLTSRGVPAEQASTRLRTTLNLIANPTAKAQKALQELGITQSQLATDMRQRGLGYALQDLQNHLDHTFPPGGHITIEQEREALLKYGDSLQAAGVKGASLEKDLRQYKQRLEETGGAAVKQGQVIADAFGGARMGTTMMTLMQNLDDVRKHEGLLGRSGAAQRFQREWQATQKDFSVQVSQMWAGIQRLGISLGDFLIPKVKALVTALIDAGKWLGRHKVLADALAVAFGTLLTAAVVAFFGKLIFNAGKSLLEIGKFGKYMAYDLPRAIMAGDTKIQQVLKSWVARLRGVQEEAAATGDEMAAAGDQGAVGGVAGGAAGGVEGALTGMIEGMITGVRGTTAPGSAENPLAVVVMATESFGLGARGAAAEAKTVTSVESQAAQAEAGAGQMVIPGMAAAPAAEGALATEAGLVAPGIMSRIGGAAKGAMRFVGGALMPGAIGLGVGSMAQSALGLRGGTTGTLGGGVAGGAIGMALGGPIGAGIGAALGSSLGPTIAHALGSIFGGGPSAGQRAAQAVTHGITGSIAAPITGEMRSVRDVQAAIQRNVDQAQQHLQPVSVAWRLKPPDQRQQDQAKNDLEQAGKLAGAAFITGYQQHVRDVSGVSLVNDFESKMKVLPKSMGGIAKSAAASQMLEYAAGLEANKKLPVGETAKIIKELESYYPNLKDYLVNNAESTASELGTVFQLKTARSSLQGAVKFMKDQFGYMPKDAKVSLDNMTQQFTGGMAYLKTVIDSSVGQQRKDAIAAYKQLSDQFDGYLKLMETRTAQHMTNIQTELKQGSNKAVDQVVPYWNEYTTIIGQAEAANVITVQKGNQMIAGELDKALQALGLTSHQAKNLARAGYNVQDLSNLQHGARGAGLAHVGRVASHAGGGLLPGAEFGRGDVMTLVDPQGNPRAKMAGDEAIFNRWQMPYVEAGLQALGFQGSNELWQKVNTPHGVGYERGGQLPGFVRGGPLGANGPYSQYALPIPLRYLRDPATWSPDAGIDVSLPAHTPEYAVGPGVIVQEGIQGFGPWAPILRVLAGPLRGDEFYYGHAGPNFAHKGQHVAAGQMITQVGAGIVGISTGPHIEFGFWPPRGGTVTGKFLQALLAGAGVMQFGNGATGGAWTDIRAPRVRGEGAGPEMVQGVLNQVTRGANQYGRSQSTFTGLTGAGWTGGGSNAQNEQLGRKMMRAAGWGANQWPYLQKLWTQESGWQTHATNPSSGAYGIPQSLPADKMSSAGADWRNNPATQIAWGLNYIKGRYGSPQAAWAHEVANNWYAGGGYLRHFAGGGKSWGTLPSSAGRLPGYRPPRLRRSTGGLHTVGGRGSTGRSSGSSGRTGTRRGGRSPSQSRPHQTLSQTVANTLDKLGFGSFADDQNELGRLDTQYTDQSNLFSLYDTGAGMPLADLDVLMGIKEQEWDILYKEFVTLPGAIASLTKTVSKDEGTEGSPGHYRTVRGKHHGKTGKSDKPGKPHLKWVPPTMPSGVAGLTKEVDDTETDIAALRVQSTAASHQVTSIHHGVSQDIMNLADQYGSETSKYLDYINAVHTQLYKNSQARIGFHNQMRQLAQSRAAGPDLNTIISIIMSNSPLPTSTALSHNPQYQHYQDQIAQLQSADLTLRQQSYDARQRLHTLLTTREADARRYRQAGFDAAWSKTLDKWKIQAKIASLEATLKKMKESLKSETATLKANQSALQTLENWQSGGLQGTEAVSSSLESIIYDILGLYQQGASLPTGGVDYYGTPRSQSGPTLSFLEKVLSSAPPSGLGLTLPAGLTQGAAAAAQAVQDFANFQDSRAALFAQFGSNFAPVGVGIGAGTAAIGSGVQFFGAAAGPEAGLGAPGGTAPGFAEGGYLGPTGSRWSGGPGAGGTTINIENHFAAGPPDPHTWSAGVSHELTAMG